MAKATEQATTRKPIAAFRQSTAHPYDRLPFVFTPHDGTARIFWAPRSTDDYHVNCDLGAEYAEATIPMLRNDPHLLQLIVLGILERGDKVRDRGVVVGFMSRISHRLIVGPQRQLRAVCALAEVV